MPKKRKQQTQSSLKERLATFGKFAVHQGRKSANLLRDRLEKTFTFLKKPQEVLLLEKKPGPTLWVDPKVDADLGPNRDASVSGITSPERNRIVESHFRDHPEGDPAVRRINPDRGRIPVEQDIMPGVMRVSRRRPKTKQSPTSRIKAKAKARKTKRAA